MMLQRAASNAYSWWWASHIRTKQSKWLEQNLQDMEEKVQTMLKLIEEDGDSFAKRAEMYYKKRPELINFVEESYRAYRSLAERYDHISTELQNANTTIASVFPDQVQFAMDDDDDDPTPRFMKKSQDSSTSNIPNVPKMPIKDIKGLITTATKKLQPKKLMKYKNLGAADNSGIGKSEAMQEIDKLQKEILTLQTEKEFVKSSYESGLAKYWEIEKHIKEKQERICSLQDEFGTSMAIEDDEARRLMASTALKSCQEKLDHLQEEQEKSAEEAKVEHQRIRNSREKLEFLKDQLLVEGISQEKSSVKDDSAETAKQSKELEYEIDKASEKRKELDSLREKIKEHFVVGANASLTVTEMAEKIDELVNKVIRLETAVSSQTALIQRLRTETDELQAQIQTLEDDKVTLMDDKNYLCKKLRELQEKLHGLQGLDLSVKDQGDNLQTHFTEARCSLDHISDKLQTVKPDEEAEVTSSSLPEKKSPVEVEPNGLVGESAMDPNEESKKLSTAKEYQELNVTGSAQKEENVAEVKSKDQQEKLDQGGGFEAQVDVRGQDLSVIGADQGENISKSQASDDLETLLGKQVACKKVDDLPSNEPDGSLEKQTSHKKCDTVPSNEPQEQKIQKEDEPNWKELFLNSLKDREKLLLTEYTTVLRNYKEVKKKFNEAEVKLKNTKTVKDEEIKSLNQKLSLLEAGLRDNNDMKEFKPSDNQQEQSVEGGTPKTRQIYEEDDFGMMLLDQNQTASPIEEQFRMNIDELLEENLDFWLRFSTSFHQIQKFDTGIQDLQSEISKLEERKKQDGSSTAKYAMRSDVRPIYRHLREIHTELTVWLEKSALLKDELKSRFSSLCNIQDEITKALKASAEDYDFKFTSYQAAKFQGEILNMKQENNKVADELQAGLDHITTVQLEVEKTLTKLTEDFALSGSKKHPNTQLQHSDSKSRVPLRSFIFGVKPKKQKQSIFSCMHPSLYRKIKTTSS